MTEPQDGAPIPRTIFDLEGRTALVTGAAHGIGRAIAEGLATFGANVVLTDIDESAGAAAAATLSSRGFAALFTPSDVTRTSSASAACDAAWNRFGSLDILVNNAGMSQRTPAESYPDEDLDRIVDLNLKAVFTFMRTVASRWIERKERGKIINLASFAGMVADPLSAPYAATKGGVVQLTRTCAVEWAPHGIHVNAIGPGYTRTSMTEPALSDPRTVEAILAKTPLGRVAEPMDLVGAAVFLASKASDYVTGHVLMVDGGWTAI